MPLGDSHQGLCSQGAPGLIVRGVAHDYRNRLQTIFSALGAIKESASTGRISDILPLASAAQNLLKGAGDLSSNVLSAACPPHWELEHVEINSALEALGPVLSGLCGKSVDFQTERLPRKLPVLCSRRLLENAVINLVINADDAIEDEGVITVATTAFDPMSRIGNGMGWSVASITVSDTGKGMTDEVLRRAFSPEFSTKASGRGTGLGLMMTRLFAEQAGGTVKIHSEMGQGTSVSILLPEAMPAARQPNQRDLPVATLIA